ncbi:hypothetical protein QFZ31_004790 [Neobacillus niacini]|uniref:hypothetical protein n=1 Tax=Neobacillus driksii TaxID=3035913 RepID=UPI002780BDE0|nr:hypothetical protein [Neobacillus niacini]MDQ0974912.1 hypothetical protein [Neobacillus niacini]
MTEEHAEKAFGSKQVVWSDRRACKKAFGSMQVVWSDRRACRKSVWVNAGVLEWPKEKAQSIKTMPPLYYFRREFKKTFCAAATPAPGSKE